MQLSPETRLFDKIKIDHNGCWIWTGYKCKRGYGRIKINGKMVYTHRFAKALDRGAKIPKNMDTDHFRMNIDRSSCSTSCCNPNHLEVVTRRENLRRSPRVKKSQAENGRKSGPANGRMNGLANRKNDLPEGVYADRSKYQARIYDPRQRKIVYLGLFNTAAEASNYYQLSRIRLEAGFRPKKINKINQ